MRLAGVLATVPTAGDALVAAAPLLIGTGCTWTRGHGRCGRAVTLVGPFVCDQCRDAGAVPMQRKRLLQEVAVTPDPWRNRVGNLIRAAVESDKAQACASCHLNPFIQEVILGVETCTHTRRNLYSYFSTGGWCGMDHRGT